MKQSVRYFLTTFLLTLHFSPAGFSQSKAEQIDSLLAIKSYFLAQEAYNKYLNGLEPVQQLQFGALIDNIFNRLEASNAKIARLKTEFREQIPDSIMYHLLEIQQTNFGKLYEYEKASQIIDESLAQYAAIMTKEEIAELHNMQEIWTALKDAPKQQIAVEKETTIVMHRDKADLWNLDVKRGTETIGFIFDTGANISVVSESTAARLNMDLIEARIEVNSITGLKVQSKLAVCPEFRLGDITVRNAVFLVFPDSALAIPQIDYQINGIIGFPVIEGMKEVHITRSGEFIVPAQRSRHREQNMALDFLTPILRVDDESYTFDSGAGGTMLYKTYYDAHRKQLEGKYREQDLQYGGAGGNITRKGYLITWRPVVSGKKLKVKDVMTFREANRDHENLFYGNIGQDVIGQFETMTLNFEEMFILLE